MPKKPSNPWVLIDFCDWIAQNGCQSVPIDNLSAWGLEGSQGTYSGSHPCSMGTTVILSLGDDRGTNSDLSGACAKLVRQDQDEDILRVDWRSWAKREKDRRPHVHLNGSRIFIDQESSWQDVRSSVIETMEEELDLSFSEDDEDDRS